MNILLVILIMVLLTSIPWGGYHPYGYWPSGGIGILVIVLIVLLLTGHL